MLSTNFNIRVYGIKVIIHDIINKKTLSINCLIDDLMVKNIEDKYIKDRKIDIEKFMNENKNELYREESLINYIKNLSLKDYLIYNNDDLYLKYKHLMNQIKNIENKTINEVVQEFIGSDLFNQRTLLIQLLLNNYKQEFEYLAYLYGIPFP